MIETLKELLPLATAVLALILAILRTLLPQRSSRLQTTKDELDLLIQSIDRGPFTEGHTTLLKEIYTEKLLQQIFKISLRPEEIPALTALYSLEKFSVSDIRNAWPYRQFKDGNLLFLSSFEDKFTLIFTQIYTVLLFILLGISLLISALSSDIKTQFTYLGFSALFFAFITLFLHQSHLELF